jgi:sugar lactone lactonase YvrE
VTPGGKIKDWVILPNGPWIKSCSTLYTLRHFPRGPACYSNMRIWAGNGQLYIGVSGDPIDTSVEGVYRLDARKEEWENIIAGTLDNGLILSPSGCQIGYAAGG